MTDRQPEPTMEAGHEAWCWRRHTGDCVDGPGDSPTADIPPVESQEFTMTYRELMVALDRVQPDADNGYVVLAVVAAVREARVR